MNKINAQMLSHADLVVQWLASFEAALTAGDEAALRALMGDEFHWRDLLAFTWTITPHHDPDSAIADLMRTRAEIGARNFRLAAHRTPPRQAMRHGVPSVEAFFSFETNAGRGSGIVRLIAAQPEKAWVMATSLDEIKSHEEPINARWPAGSANSRNFGGENWSDIRTREQAFDNREPAVVIIGAGQAGLAGSPPPG